MGLMDIRRRILADAPQLATATGAIASFTTGMAAKLKSCVFEVNPVQTGTGDPAPDNVRPISGWTGVAGAHTGKNLLNPNATEYYNYTIGPTGEEITSSNDRICTGYIPFVAGVSVTASGAEKWYFAGGGQYASFSFAGIVYYTKEKAFISRTFANAVNNITGATPANTAYIRFFMQYNDHSNPTPAIFESLKIQLEFGSTPTAYAPYTGASYPVTFPAFGKNLFALPFEDYRNVPASIENYFFIKAGTYIFSFADSTADSWRYIVRLKDKDGNVLSDNAHNPSGTLSYRDSVTGYTNGSNTVQKSIVLTIIEDCFIRLLWWNTGSLGTTFSECQLETGDAATAYEPYTNTIYGGTLDAVNGVLTVDRASVLLSAFDFTTLSSPDQHIFRAPFVNVLSDIVDHANGSMTYGDICDSFTYKEWAPASGSDNGKFAFSPKTKNKLVVIDHRFSSTLDFQAAVKDVRLVYYLATPITYQLTPQQINALKGQNNVWCDTGNTTVQYWKH